MTTTAASWDRCDTRVYDRPVGQYINKETGTLFVLRQDWHNPRLWILYRWSDLVGELYVDSTFADDRDSAVAWADERMRGGVS